MGVCGDVVGTPLQARMVSALVLHFDDLAVGDELQGIYRIVECGTATWLHEPISRNADR